MSEIVNDFNTDTKTPVIIIAVVVNELQLSYIRASLQPNESCMLNMEKKILGLLACHEAHKYVTSIHDATHHRETLRCHQAIKPAKCSCAVLYDTHNIYVQLY